MGNFLSIFEINPQVQQFNFDFEKDPSGKVDFLTAFHCLLVWRGTDVEWNPLAEEVEKVFVENVAPMEEIENECDAMKYPQRVIRKNKLEPCAMVKAQMATSGQYYFNYNGCPPSDWIAFVRLPKVETQTARELIELLAEKAGLKRYLAGLMQLEPKDDHNMISQDQLHLGQASDQAENRSKANSKKNNNNFAGDSIPFFPAENDINLNLELVDSLYEHMVHGYFGKLMLDSMKKLKK